MQINGSTAALLGVGVGAIAGFAGYKATDETFKNGNKNVVATVGLGMMTGGVIGEFALMNKVGNLAHVGAAPLGGILAASAGIGALIGMGGAAGSAFH